MIALSKLNRETQVTDQHATRRLLVQALLAESPGVAAAAGRDWLKAVDIRKIGNDQARMLPMLCKRLHELDVEQPPLLREAYQNAWVQNQLRIRTAAPLLDRLRAAGVRSVLLKGASLIPAYGGDWGLRAMSDVDVLIAPQHLEQALVVLDAEAWQGLHGVSSRTVAVRLAQHRHSWNFMHTNGHSVDLHWHVLVNSRAHLADAAFWSAAVPLAHWPTRASRLCDGDLLLHVLEHAGHDEESSRVQWAVDAVMLLRSTPDVNETARRFTHQAASHDLLPEMRERLSLLAEFTDEERVATVATAAQTGRRRRRLLAAEYRRGDVPIGKAVRFAVGNRFDGRLARSRVAWFIYVATGRRAVVERLLSRLFGPLATTLRPPTGPTASGWWALASCVTVDEICGPGWSFPAWGYGIWSEGPEARLVLPTRGATNLELELQVLPRYNGPARTVEIRVNGKVRQTIEAPAEHAAPEILTLPLPATGQVEVAFVIRKPARPSDLGVNTDTRRLGVQVIRLRLS